MPIKLGDRVRDVYTKFTGIAIGRTQWLTGCDRIGIKPEKLDKDGKPQEVEWFDEPHVELVRALKPKVSKESRTAKPGGPQRDPVNNRRPK